MRIGSALALSTLAVLIAGCDSAPAKPAVVAASDQAPKTFSVGNASEAPITPVESTEVSTPQGEPSPEPKASPPSPGSVAKIGNGNPIKFAHWNGLRKGSGTEAIGGRRRTLELADFSLLADGSAHVMVRGGSESSTYIGSWKRAPDEHSVELQLSEEGKGASPASLTGTLKFMDAENPHELKLDGKTSAGKSLAIQFRMGG